MKRAFAYLQLLRLPTIFTAQADILLGYALKNRGFEPVGDLVLLLCASAGLYLSGMVFNDVFDRHVDAKERPGRPLPSGRLSLIEAIVLGTVLMFGGIVAAALVGKQSLYVALGLAACILAYDGWFKKTRLGPVFMGACRGFNIILGASNALPYFLVWARPQLWVAAAMTVYVLGITWFARQEAEQSSRRQLSLAMIAINAGLAGLMFFVTQWPSPGSITMTLFVLAVITLTIDRRLILAVSDPSPARVQVAIKTMLLSIIMLDATIAFFHTNEPMIGLTIALLLIPALLLARVIRMT